jgi:hypothetical protein
LEELGVGNDAVRCGSIPVRCARRGNHYGLYIFIWHEARNARLHFHGRPAFEEEGAEDTQGN